MKPRKGAFQVTWSLLVDSLGAITQVGLESAQRVQNNPRETNNSKKVLKEDVMVECPTDPPLTIMKCDNVARGQSVIHHP